MNQSIENDLLKGEFVKHILSGNHKMKSVMKNELHHRCVRDYYSNCLAKFIPTDNQHIRNLLNLNDEIYTRYTKDGYNKDDMISMLTVYFIHDIIIWCGENGTSTLLWKYIEKIINIPDEEMTPEVIELMQYILKVLF